MFVLSVKISTLTISITIIIEYSVILESVFYFFCSHTYICVRLTDGAARILFVLSLSLPERVTLWSRIIPVHVREREREVRRKKKKKAQKKHFAVTGI